MRRAGLVLALALAGAGCRDGGSDGGQPAASPIPSVPPPFAGRANPLPADDATVARGRALFGVHCAPCHGSEGRGDGVAAAGLDPRPANFHDKRRIASKSDDYLFWRVATGVPESAMPAFAGTLGEEDRWAILRFVRSLTDREPAPTGT